MNKFKQISLSILRWFDTGGDRPANNIEYNAGTVNWLGVAPYLIMHLACLAVFWTGASYTAVGFAFAIYVLRMFAITGFYHRYFSHRTFKTNRFWQFIFAIIGLTAAQRGPIWWAAHHREHHANSDQPADPHSPVQHSFWWSHVGWFLHPSNSYIDRKYVSDLTRYPELVFLDRFDTLVPFTAAIIIYFVGQYLAVHHPDLNTNGWQLVIWTLISTVVVSHCTGAINSLAHRVGRRRYVTTDQSRNNWWLAILTLGEGWHNNHHHYPGSTRQGFYWWEVDITYYILKALNWLGIIYDLRPVPLEIRENQAKRVANKTKS